MATRRIVGSVLLALLFTGSSVAQHANADYYWGYSVSNSVSNATIYAYTVTEGSMSQNQCPPAGCLGLPVHTYYATVSLSGPSGHGTTDGTNQNTVTGFTYGSTRMDDSIVVTNPESTYYISTSGRATCQIAGAYFTASQVINIFYTHK